MGSSWVTAVQVLARQREEYSQIIGRFKLGEGHTKIRERVLYKEQHYVQKWAGSSWAKGGVESVKRWLSCQPRWQQVRNGQG